VQEREETAVRRAILVVGIPCGSAARRGPSSAQEELEGNERVARERGQFWINSSTYPRNVRAGGHPHSGSAHCRDTLRPESQASRQGKTPWGWWSALQGDRRPSAMYESAECAPLPERWVCRRDADGCCSRKREVSVMKVVVIGAHGNHREALVNALRGRHERVIRGSASWIKGRHSPEDSTLEFQQLFEKHQAIDAVGELRGQRSLTSVRQSPRGFELSTTAS